MNWQFGRINLQDCPQGHQDLDWAYLDPPPVYELTKIYHTYCRHKQFTSVMPMIAGRFQEPNTEVIGYRDRNQLVAWSLIRKWDDHNILADHWAWDYANPDLRLGIRSIRNECQIYRDRGFRFMYFERVESYMMDLPGFEVLGGLA